MRYATICATVVAGAIAVGSWSAIGANNAARDDAATIEFTTATQDANVGAVRAEIRRQRALDEAVEIGERPETEQPMLGLLMSIRAGQPVGASR